MDILIGADPELFVTKNGVLQSAFGLVAGTKKQPVLVKDGGLQVDGMALEFNIDPCADGDQLVRRIHSVLDQMRAAVPDYQLSIVPVAMFDKAHFDAQPPEAKELGCDPDFNAWTSSVNVKPDNTTTMRTAAGHVHIGWRKPSDDIDDRHIGMCEDLVKQMDFYLGLPSLMFDPDTKRRDMYGKAGAYRPKPYGVEYRTLSNKWITDDGLIRWVDRAVRKGVDDLISGRALVKNYGDIQSIINTSNITEARLLIEDAGLDCDFGNSVESLRHAA